MHHIQYICSSEGGNMFFLRGCWHVNRAVLLPHTIVSVLITSCCLKCSEASRRVRNGGWLDQPASTRASTADRLITAANYQTHWCQLHANALCLKAQRLVLPGYVLIVVFDCLTFSQVTVLPCFMGSCIYLCMHVSMHFWDGWLEQKLNMMKQVSSCSP